LTACGTDDSDKDKCVTDEDCLTGNLCNLERTSGGKTGQKGQCMKASSDGFFLCSRENPCPAGQFCFNGLCAPGCMTDQDCAANQYCDTKVDLPNNQLGTHMCVNKEVPSCSTDGECAETQECVMGLCSAAAVEQQCTPRPDGVDGCDDYSICLDLGEVDQEQNSCVTFPPCPQDGNCPVGQVGSVCNEGDIPNKARICLTSLCKSVANCPGGFKCIIPSDNLGMCSNGTLGMPCMTADDCSGGLTCFGAMGNAPGFCVQGTTPQDCDSAGGTCIDPMTEDCPAGTQMDQTKQCSDITETCCI
jgi:hypothetical protein